MKFKEGKNWLNIVSWLSDEEVITLVVHLLWSGKEWKKLTLLFEYELDKEDVVFEDSTFKLDFLSRAEDVELQELEYIILGKKDGSEVTFRRFEGCGWLMEC